ncbi:MAG: DNA polymerase III subunit delta' [Candidatus Kerfeldbacteria bacterium]|nr:DNA polymerase III subunit delta' [Candidatus Kerfeldbacteria bacterium]
MTSDALIGHQAAYRLLADLFDRGTPSHAYLLAGPRSVGKTTVVRQLLKYLLCLKSKSKEHPGDACQACRQIEAGTHPDVWWLKRAEGKQDITIDQIRQLKGFTNLGSLAGGLRVVVMEAAEDLNPEAANALLKVLEEPLGRTVFFLISHQPSRLLPTVRSRCFVIHFGFTPLDIIKEALVSRYKLPPAQATDLARLASGRPGVALALACSPELGQEMLTQAKGFLSLLGHNPWVAMQQLIASTLKQSDAAHNKEVEKVNDYLKVWLEVLRDIVLLKLDLPGLVRYQALEPDMNKLSSGFSLLKLLDLSQQLEQARRKLEANANIRLTLECLTINFSYL